MNLLKGKKFLLISGCISSLGLIAMGIFWWMNESKFNQAIADYTEGNCESSIGSINKLSESPLNSVFRYTARSAQVRSECYRFITAKDEETKAVKEGDFGKAMVAQNSFVTTFPESPLKKYSLSRVKAHFAAKGSSNMSSLTSCPETESMRRNDIFPNPAANVPKFLWGCVKIYTDKPETQLNFGVKLLGEFPKNELAFNSKTILLKNSLLCEQSQKFQGEQTVVFLSVIHLVCSRVYLNNANFARSMEYLDGINSSPYPIKKEADALQEEWIKDFTATSKTLSSAYSEVNDATMRCFGANAFIPWDAFRGVDCVSGRELEAWERVIQIVPATKLLAIARKFDRVRKIVGVVTTISNGILISKGLASIYDFERSKQLIKSNAVEMFDMLREEDADTRAALIRYSPGMQTILERVHSELNIEKTFPWAVSLLKKYDSP